MQLTATGSYVPQVNDVIEKNGVQIVVDIVEENEIYFRRWGKGAELPELLRTDRGGFIQTIITHAPTITRWDQGPPL